MEKIQILESLVAVVQTGSFSAAARRMNIGQPAISKGIASLEEQLGTRLFIRSTRGITPSDAGMKFYQQAVDILAKMDELMSATKAEQGTLTGNIKVSAPVTLTRHYILPQLKNFLEEHPLLNIDFILDDRNTDLIGEGVDVSLRIGQLPDSGYTATRINIGKRYVMATPEYLDRFGTPKEPSDLLFHKGIVYNVGNGGTQWTLYNGENSQEIVIHGQVKSNSAEAVRDCVMEGMGYTINSEWMFCAELASGKIVRLLPEWSLDPLTLWAVYPTGKLVSGRIKAFVDFVRTCFD